MRNIKGQVYIILKKSQIAIRTGVRTPSFGGVASREPAIVILAILALILRVVDLDLKPPHFDEGINGHFVRLMWREGFYRYDPTNFHGPLYFYILQFAQLFFGEGIFAFRLVTGFISSAVVIVAGLHRRFLGTAAVWAAAVIALSPGFVFYSRYAIHESLYIFFEVLFSYGFFLWREERSPRSYWCLLVGLLGAFATKETFFIFFGTWFIASYLTRKLERFFPLRVSPPSRPVIAYDTKPPIDRDDMIANAVLGLLVTVMLFTGFFMNEKGFSDMIDAYAFWTKTGLHGTGHEKPVYYWLMLMWRYEWPCLIAFFALPVSFIFGSRMERIVALTAFGTWLAYTLIPYKTPWLILSMLWPLAMVSGFVLVRFPQRVVTASLVAGLVWSSYEMLRLNFRDYAAPVEPYVYVQSTMEFKEATGWIAERVRRYPEELNMKLLILTREAWPMPWMFQDFPRLEYAKPAVAELKDADVILVDAVDRQELERRLNGKFWVEPFQIRDSYAKGFAFFRYEKFNGIVPSSSAIFAHEPNAERGLGSEKEAR